MWSGKTVGTDNTTFGNYLHGCLSPAARHRRPARPRPRRRPTGRPTAIDQKRQPPRPQATPQESISRPEAPQLVDTITRKRATGTGCPASSTSLTHGSSRLRFRPAKIDSRTDPDGVPAGRRPSMGIVTHTGVTTSHTDRTPPRIFSHTRCYSH